MKPLPVDSIHSRRERVKLVIAAVLIGLMLLLPLYVLRSLNSLRPKPKQPFTGDWRGGFAFPLEERPLPKTHEIWKDWEQWNSDKDVSTTRVYWAKIGGRKRQTNFKIEYLKSHNMPWGDYIYTYATFVYSDPRGGQCLLTWTRPGRHDPPGLRLGDAEKLVLVEPWGSTSGSLPWLNIVAMEGVEPRYPTPEK
jgi:hypothetical protein